MLKPPPGVDIVSKVVLILLTNEKKNLSWEAGKRLMANVGHFKARLENYRCAFLCFSAVLLDWIRLYPAVQRERFPRFVSAPDQ